MAVIGSTFGPMEESVFLLTFVTLNKSKSLSGLSEQTKNKEKTPTLSGSNIIVNNYISQILTKSCKLIHSELFSSDVFIEA